MGLLANKRSTMTLYSDPTCIYCHQVRMVLAEKAITADIADINPDRYPRELAEVNPYQSLPVLADRDVVLYDTKVILEYLDERFPHPPLLPVYPVARAKSRLMIYRIERDWYSLVYKIQNEESRVRRKAAKELQDSLMSVNAIFADKAFFLNDEFSLVDCWIVPLLWRLPSFGVELPTSAKAIHKYMDRLFARDGFKASLTEQERELRS